MKVAWPVVTATDLVPTDVMSVACPLDSVVRKVVVKGSSVVDTRGVVLTIAVEWGVAEVAGALLD